VDDPAGSASDAERVIGRDLQEPAAQQSLVADGRTLLEGGQERLDHDVLGLGAVAQDQVGDRLELAPVGLEQRCQRFRSPVTEILDGHRCLGGVRWRPLGRPPRRIDARRWRSGLVADGIMGP
jgi:hypothetical protein